MEKKSFLEYEGYRALIEFSQEDDTFVGKVVGIDDQIVFDGKSVRELKRNFKAVVDNYVAHCRERGEEPEREYSGRFNLRLSPEQHRKLARDARRQGKSLNELVAERLFG